MPELACGSRIERVDVYARGAVVTRAVTPDGDLPDGPVTLRVGGLSPLAEAGSVHADVTGGREVVSLSTRLVVPASPSAPGPALERLRDLELARQALEAERVHLEWRRGALAQRELKPGLSPRGRFSDPAARTADALAVGGLLSSLAAEIDRRLAEIDEALADNARDREAAELEAAQARSADRAGRGHPTIEAIVGLSAGPPIGALGLVYVVGAARWWPRYTVQLGASGTRAAWTLGAVVAQATAEDWEGVRLGLSTADLARSARLPALPSLRIGRMQAVPRTGYRAPPPDLDALFEGWDRAAADLGLAIGPPAAPSDDSVTITRYPTGLAAPEEELHRDHDEVTPVFSLTSLAQAELAQAGPASRAPAQPAAPPPAAAAPARRSLPREQARPRGRPAAAEDGPALEGGLGAPMSVSLAAAPVASRMAFAAHAAGPAAAIPDVGIEPADTWLDFDALRLAAPEDHALRGRLVREAPEGRGARDDAAAIIEALPSPGLAQDPLATRGQFDARWEADGLADVPSDARPHQVTVGHAEGPGRTRLRTVPRETAEVFREAWLDNPFDLPLLSGPVDVLVDGALVATSPMGAVDWGGLVRFGLGVEERVRVARNVSVDEGSAGLLGGSTAIDHLVTIDLRSSLGHPAQLEVIDRVPVAGDPDVDVSVSTRPEASAYDQSERGQPVRGGLRWVVELAAGGQARLELRYRVKLPSSSEVTGGNRRE